MVVHIVMFKFQEVHKTANLEKAKEMLENLMGSVPTLLSMEVGLNIAEEERAMDLSIVTTFADKEGLQEYAVHPEHLKVVEFIRCVTEYSKVVDYEKN
ncbi:MAG: Dabb family protein [Sulfurovum sp.]|nr:Dabb family protein [Sulfurovum sp.]